MRNILTEKDLSRIVKRVINEQQLKKCDSQNFRLIREVLQNNAELTLTYNKPSSGLVMVSTNAPTPKNIFPCACRKELLLSYIQ
jgi:hypothetical protein